MTRLLYAYGYRISAILIATGYGGLLGQHLHYWAFPIVIPSCLCMGYIATKLDDWKEDSPMDGQEEQEYIMSQWIAREVRLPPEGWILIDDLSRTLDIHRDCVLEGLVLRGALSLRGAIEHIANQN